MATIDERLEAIVQSVELLLAESREHSKQLAEDANNIRALARIAELHHARLERIEEAQS